MRLLRALYTESQAFGPKRQSETRSIRNALDLLDEEIDAERGTIYGVDENLGDYKMKSLQEWRKRLVVKAASA
ncbi:hypothetical protein [Streptomyces sp. NBC_00019]|uniref:hypothetical protein n=1 Tax=Streptomyces sp. NBC_00019 TaxID=2975623 RepID=UPI00324AC8DF